MAWTNLIYANEIIYKKETGINPKRRNPGMPAMRNGPGFVYIMSGLCGLLKIGSTINPKARADQIRYKHHIEAKIIILIETNNMNTVERNLHNFFSHKHVIGEWFDLSDEDLETIIGVFSLENSQ